MVRILIITVVVLSFYLISMIFSAEASTATTERMVRLCGRDLTNTIKILCKNCIRGAGIQQSIYKREYKHNAPQLLFVEAAPCMQVSLNPTVRISNPCKSAIQKSPMFSNATCRIYRTTHGSIRIILT